MSFKYLLIAPFLLFFAISANAQTFPNNTLQLEDILIGQFDIKGLGYHWDIYKVCVDYQAYMISPGHGGLEITASFKDGKPEQCSLGQDSRK